MQRFLERGRILSFKDSSVVNFNFTREKGHVAVMVALKSRYANMFVRRTENCINGTVLYPLVLKCKFIENSEQSAKDKRGIEKEVRSRIGEETVSYYP